SGDLLDIPSVPGRSEVAIRGLTTEPQPISLQRRFDPRQSNRRGSGRRPSFLCKRLGQRVVPHTEGSGRLTQNAGTTYRSIRAAQRPAPGELLSLLLVSALSGR